MKPKVTEGKATVSNEEFVMTVLGDEPKIEAFLDNIGHIDGLDYMYERPMNGMVVLSLTTEDEENKLKVLADGMGLRSSTITPVNA